jgi:hypothetical protein
MFENLKTIFKNGHKSKTVLFGYALTILAGLQSMSGEIAAVFKDHTPSIMLGIGITVVILRALTSQPLEDK